MMTYRVSDICRIVAGRLVGSGDAMISRLLTDSRSLTFPEETLFFALRTERNDGHRYVENLYQRGVRNFVIDDFPDEFQSLEDANWIVVDNTLQALQTLASYHRGQYDISIVGITGSNGKTIVKEWLYQILSEETAITRSPRSYNSQIGVPLSVWNIDSRTELAIIEAGISHHGEMERLEKIINPTIGVLTHIGVAHQENFESKRQKIEEKLRLFKNAELLVYRSDNETVRRCVENQCTCKLFSWSTTDKKATLYVEQIDKKDSETAIVCQHNGATITYRLPFIDDASIENSVHCLCLSIVLGYDTEKIVNRLEHLEPVAMRLEVKEGINDITLINDSYNSDIHSLEIALDFMSRRTDKNNRKHTLIISDIEQSGMSGLDLYSEVALLTKQHAISKIIGIGHDISASKHLFTNLEKAFFPTVDDFLKSPIFATLRSEVILLKGARRFKFERITALLVKKVHETILEVNLDALVDNLNYYRSFLHSETKLVCMIKADAYGAGALEVAKTLQDHRVDYLAVAVADEGAQLRQGGIGSNIMIMNPEMSAFRTIFDYGLEPEVYSFRLLEALISSAEQLGISNYPIHLKLDTGMHRLGFAPDTDINRLISTLKRQQALKPRSVFTHFAGADDDAFDTFSDEQYRRFDEASTKIQSSFDHKILRHICNSAGIEHFPERQLDMCRLGLGLYGISPRGNRLLHTVSTLKTTILQIRDVKATDTVGYSRRGELNRDSRIAAIPVGYADGLNRNLGRGAAYCLVNGMKAPYLGNICMDVAMIDVTDIACKEGDMVEIFGENLPVTVLSDKLNTIPYEVLTGISNRVKRVYFHS